jgi:hypothetical protein
MRRPSPSAHGAARPDGQVGAILDTLRTLRGWASNPGPIEDVEDLVARAGMTLRRVTAGSHIPGNRRSWQVTKGHEGSAT